MVLTPLRLDPGQIGAVALPALTVSLDVLVLRGPLVVQDVGMIDSESPRTAAERKAALRRQQQLLREDIENLHSRALLQVPRDPSSGQLCSIVGVAAWAQPVAACPCYVFQLCTAAIVYGSLLPR